MLTAYYARWCTSRRWETAGSRLRYPARILCDLLGPAAANFGTALRVLTPRPVPALRSPGAALVHMRVLSRNCQVPSGVRHASERPSASPPLLTVSVR